MIQSKSSPKDQLNAAKTRIQAQFSSGLLVLETEGKKLLNELGADLANKDRSLKAIVARMRKKSPSLKQFAINLDASTYDLRAKANWNVHMMSAYAKLQAERAYIKEFKPKVNSLLETVNSKLKQVAEKADQLKARLDK